MLAASLTAAASARRVVLLWLAAALVLPATSAMACEKHLNGHQNSSQTAAEANQ